MAHASMTGDVMRISSREPMISIARLQNALAQLSSGIWRMFTIGIPSRSSKRGFEDI